MSGATGYTSDAKSSKISEKICIEHSCSNWTVCLGTSSRGLVASLAVMPLLACSTSLFGCQTKRRRIGLRDAGMEAQSRRNSPASRTTRSPLCLERTWNFCSLASHAFQMYVGEDTLYHDELTKSGVWRWISYLDFPLPTHVASSSCNALPLPRTHPRLRAVRHRRRHLTMIYQCMAGCRSPLNAYLVAVRMESLPSMICGQAGESRATAPVIIPRQAKSRSPPLYLRGDQAVYTWFQQ